MTIEGKPRRVKEAIFRHDHEALKRMGHKGAEKRALKKEIVDAERKEQIRDAVSAQIESYTISPEGDILPPTESTPPSEK